MNLFPKGYIATRISAKSPPIKVAKFNCNKIISPKNNKISNKIIALFNEISLFANGRFFVLLTFLSNFLSKISLIMQPAERIIIDPTKNNKIILSNS